jgi:hypothetical protein
MIIRDRSDDDIPWMSALLLQRWNGKIMYIHGEAIDAMALPALVSGDRKGLATYRIRDGEAELISLDAIEPDQGVGTRLLAVERLTRRPAAATGHHHQRQSGSARLLSEARLPASAHARPRHRPNAATETRHPTDRRERHPDPG